MGGSRKGGWEEREVGYLLLEPPSCGLAMSGLDRKCCHRSSLVTFSALCSHSCFFNLLMAPHPGFSRDDEPSLLVSLNPAHPAVPADRGSLLSVNTSGHSCWDRDGSDTMTHQGSCSRLTPVTQAFCVQQGAELNKSSKTVLCLTQAPGTQGVKKHWEYASLWPVLK